MQGGFRIFLQLYQLVAKVALAAVTGYNIHSCQVAREKSSGNCQTAMQASASLSNQQDNNQGWNGDLLEQI